METQLMSLGHKAFDPARPTIGRYPLRMDLKSLRSIHILGQPGYGKSTLLGRLAETFADLGHGVLVIDIRGDLATNLVCRTKHADRLILVDPVEASTTGHYWSLNPMDFDRKNPQLFDRYTDRLPDLFARIGIHDPTLMQTIEKLLTEGVRLALATPDTSLLDVYLALHDDRHRERLLRSRHVPPLTRDYFQEVFTKSDHPLRKNNAGGMTPRDRRIAIDSTDSRLRQVLGGNLLNRMLIQPHTTLNIAQWLDEGKLVVVNLDQSRMGERTARKMGNLILGALSNDIIQRPTGEVSLPWRIIVDEAAELANRPFAEMITQMRTHSVYPILAHQNLSQLKDETLADAVSQASCKIRFRLSEVDAKTIADRYSPEFAAHLMSLPPYRARVMWDASDNRLVDSRLGVDVDLQDWWGVSDTAQLTAALAAQRSLAQHESHQRQLLHLERFKTASKHGVMEGAYDDDPTDDKTYQPPPRPDEPGSEELPETPDGGDPSWLGRVGSPVPVPGDATQAHGPAVVSETAGSDRPEPESAESPPLSPASGQPQLPLLAEEPGLHQSDLNRDSKRGLGDGDGDVRPDAEGIRGAPGAPTEPRPGGPLQPS
jgi:hypothetical protein